MAALLLDACSHATPPPGQPELKHLDFTGNLALSNSAIAGRVATQADSWVPFSDARYLDRSVLQTDLRRIERLYQAHGFFDAKVTGFDEVPVEDQPDQVSVTIHIDEGQPSKITQLQLEGTESLPADMTQRLEGAVKELAIGKVFNEAAYEAAKAELATRLHNHGYAEASVEGKVEVDPAAHTAVITFNVAPGKTYVFGKVLVAGTQQVPRDKVAREVESAAPPGTLYSEKKLHDAQTNVFDLGVFSLAKVTRGAPDPSNGTVPLAADVTEAPFQTLRAGAGFGIERYRDEVHLLGRYTNRNFLGGLRKLDFDNKLAYVITSDVTTLIQGQSATGIGGYSSLTFTQPDVFLPHLDLELTGEIQRDIQVGYVYDSALASAALHKRIGRMWDFSFGANLQLIKLDTILDPRQLADSHAPQLATSCTEPSCFLLLEYLEQRIRLDLRDNPLRTRRGFLAELNLQEGGGPGASFQYLRVEPEIRFYIPLASNLVLAQRLQWGWMAELNKDANGNTMPTPLVQRFFAGGAESVRAYGARLMSPVAVVCRDTNPNVLARHCSQPGDFEAVPVGGDGLYTASTELRLEVTRTVGVVGFVDTGVVPISPFQIEAADIAVAPGLGFRYFTPFGPLRLDFAYRLPSFPPPGVALRLAPSQVVINYPPGVGVPFVSPGPTPRFNFQFSLEEAF
ncbi:MAG: BamA/TamA family outer membrane protein [Deltaproteobacteria bacterium]|nr:BamA/TamA family outer membrane protein [Deltaproteobacteria bacterium]